MCDPDEKQIAAVESPRDSCQEEVGMRILLHQIACLGSIHQAIPIGEMKHR
jgi:hypothetical protein